MKTADRYVENAAAVLLSGLRTARTSLSPISCSMHSPLSHVVFGLILSPGENVSVQSS